MVMVLPVLAAASISSTVVKTSAVITDSSPIDKVVTLITEMKAQTEKEATEDMEAYDKYKCWCVTTEKEKAAAIKAAQSHLATLNAFIEEAAGREGELKTEISGLASDIADDQAALETASSLRATENKDFSTEEADIKETLDLLSQAIGVLSKVQLV